MMRKNHTYNDAALVVLTEGLCFSSLLFLPEMVSKIKSTVSHCDSRPSYKAVCNREQGTHATLKETQCDTHDEYVYANINENTSSSLCDFELLHILLLLPAL
jgi:hypothetical protein